MFEVVQGSVRVFNIKKTKKTRGGLISAGGLQLDEYFCFQVDGPITRGAYNRNFTVVIPGLYTISLDKKHHVIQIGTRVSDDIPRPI